MNKLQVEATTDEGGSLHIQMPGRPSRYRVHVTVEWESPAEPSSEWPRGWIEATAGSVADPTFARPKQDDYEAREELE